MTDEKTGELTTSISLPGLTPLAARCLVTCAFAGFFADYFLEVWDNRVYNGRFAYSTVNDGKNMKRISSVELCEVSGRALEVKPVGKDDGQIVCVYG